MATRKRRLFVYGQTGVMLAAVTLLALLDSLTLGNVFVASLLGLLAVTELTAPVAVSPRWRVRLRWLLVAGLVGFAVLVARRVYAVLPPGVV